MKKLLTLLVAMLLFACNKSEDPKPIDPLVGTWILNKYRVGDLPDNFSSYEGQELSSLGENSFLLTVYDNAEYKQRIDFGGSDVYSDAGKWRKENDILYLDSKGNYDEEYGIAGIDVNTLVLTKVYKFSLLPNVIIEAINENTPADSVAPFRQQVDVLMYHYFIK